MSRLSNFARVALLLGLGVPGVWISSAVEAEAATRQPACAAQRVDITAKCKAKRGWEQNSAGKWGPTKGGQPGTGGHPGTGADRLVPADWDGAPKVMVTKCVRDNFYRISNEKPPLRCPNKTLAESAPYQP